MVHDQNEGVARMFVVWNGERGAEGYDGVEMNMYDMILDLVAPNGVGILVHCCILGYLHWEGRCRIQGHQEGNIKALAYTSHNIFLLNPRNQI